MSTVRKTRKGKTVWVVLGSLLALLVLVGGSLVWHFRDEIKAYQISQKYTSSELEDQLNGNDETIRDAVDAAEGVTVRAPTEEERQALQDGTLSEEELAERLTGSTESGGEPQTPTSGGSATPSDTAKEAYQKQLSALVARVYVLREQYVNTLAGMESAAKAEYHAIPEAERTRSKLLSLVSRYLDQASTLEKECDAKMDGIVSEMEQLIQENNGDMSLLDTVVYSYANEKSLKKAWYMSRLQEKGLI